MPRFHVWIVTNGLSAELDSADNAYRWLDQHASPGDSYRLSAIGPGGASTAIDEDVYRPISASGAA